ncbi:MAG: HAD-IC family P-type ATPase [Oscillospiraceae bacterium]|nr:HAD-IC family P-type ATPase [Oscillospiraceae bacterium]
MKKNFPAKRGASPPEQPARKEVPVIRADPEQGLTAQEAAQRQEAGWDNPPVQAPSKSIKEIVKENVFTFFNFIFVILAVLLIMVGSYNDMMFLLIAAANTGIGILQQVRSKFTMDNLNLLASPRASVVRDGTVSSVPTAQLVRDDIAEFAAGTQIPTDAEVVSGTVQVNESLITGEADAIEKSVGAELLSGSFVVSGKCRARLTKVGADSYASRLTLEAKKDVRVGKSDMMRSLDRMIRFIGIILIPLGVLLFSQQYLLYIQQQYTTQLAVQQSVVSTVAALIGMIPEGLYLLTSVALAVSVLRLARSKVLAQDMSCIETLARVDVLCVDKTGTITEPTMEVGEVVLLDEEKYPETQITETLTAFYSAADVDNDTARAMQSRFSGASTWRAGKVIPFTSQTKWSAVCFPSHGNFIVGAPEFVMGEHYVDLQDAVEPYSSTGYRVLLVAEYDGVPDAKTPLRTTALSPVALVLLSNRIRPEAKETFRYFAKQGVAVKVISGDNPLTVSEVARQAGIENAEQYVDAATLTSDGAIEKAVGEYTVFGRVTPNQKRKFVKALQRAGHTVAMTGDGVNDVLALKDANCGIAMASGSDAACRVAHLVLLDNNFSAMPKVVAEGRRVINNIQSAASLFLVKNILSFFLAIITLLVAVIWPAATFPYPFKPIQITLISTLTIGIPAFFLALEPNHSMVKGSFLPNVFRRAAPGGLTNLAVILLAELFTAVFAFTVDELSTMSTILMAFVGMLVLYQACKPFDIKRWIMYGSMTGAMIWAIFVSGATFSLSPLNAQNILVLIMLLALSYPIMHMFLRLFNRAEESIVRRRQPKRKKKYSP